jgi:hypothetical protein
MPIRFRCVYCNQLLGISRRKAGTIVRCTSCEGQLIVPDPSDPATEAAGSKEHTPEPAPVPPLPIEAGRENAGSVFEAEDFGAFLDPLNGGRGPAVASPPAPTVRPPTTPTAGGSIASATALRLTRKGLTVAVAAGILAVGLAFAGGLWVGLTWH